MGASASSWPGGESYPSRIDDTVITPYRDGPLLVRGSFRIVDQDGVAIVAPRQTVALCRCGRSRMRPFCDGTHRTAGFRASGGAEGRARRDGEPADHG